VVSEGGGGRQRPRKIETVYQTPTKTHVFI
jgi:hypothetical protein